MGTLLARHAEILVTMDDERREIKDGAVFARDGIVEQVGPTSEPPRPRTWSSTSPLRSSCRAS